MSGTNLQHAQENMGAIAARLGERDIITSKDQFYQGDGVASIFRTDADVAQLRVGRRHFEGHEDFTFREGNDSFAGLGNSDYAVFVPLTRKNMDAIKAGIPFDYSVSRGFGEDNEGHITQLDPNQIAPYSGDVESLVAQMPKKKIAGVSVADVRVGDSTTEGVSSSNVDDAGDVLIYSTSGFSSVLYNTESQDTPRPHFHWGSNGWKEPLEVRVTKDKLFFDDRDGSQSDGNVWLLDFNEKGYDAIPTL